MPDSPQTSRRNPLDEDISLREYLEAKIAAVELSLEEFKVFWRQERDRGRAEIDQRAEEVEKRLLEKASAQERAIDKAEDQLNARLSAMNEFRDALRDQSAKQATREHVEMVEKAIEKRLRDMENWSANMQGRLVVLGGIWGLVLIVLSVTINYAIRKAFE